jgi:hypothetical protein
VPPSLRSHTATVRLVQVFCLLELTSPDIFQRLTANGVQGDVYQNVRKNTNNNSPVTDLSSNDLRCNVGGGSGAQTTTVSVAAGSKVTFTADQAVYHQGPVSFYLSKVASASGADGSADWMKIKEIGPTFSGNQANWDMKGKFIILPEIGHIANTAQPPTMSPSPAALLLASTCSALSRSASTTLALLLSSTVSQQHIQPYMNNSANPE